MNIDEMIKKEHVLNNRVILIKNDKVDGAKKEEWNVIFFDGNRITLANPNSFDAFCQNRSERINYKDLDLTKDSFYSVKTIITKTRMV